MLKKENKKNELRELSEIEIPEEVQSVVQNLQQMGFEAYVVGGCVRDLLLGRKPKDWDITTNARPEELRKVFPKSFYENKFFTVTVQTGSKDPTLREIEITTYRSEAKYTDKRHPDEVRPAKTLEEDLARRDFTINAMALNIKSKIQNSKFKIPRPERPGSRSRSDLGINPKSKAQNSKLILIDPFGGQEDLENGLIRAVGEPNERFQEDALRLARAVRFATAFGFAIEAETLKAVIENSGQLGFISKERVRDELLKILESENAAQGIELLRKTRLLNYIIPELTEGYGMAQNKHHIYEIYDHNLRSLDAAAKKGFNIDVRLAALLHDIAKPRTKIGVGPDSTFYDHQIVGTKMTIEILERLKFPRKQIEKIAKLVRFHMFYYNVDEVTESSVRRLVRQVGPEYMEELLQLRVADRIGSGVPKAEPYKLRHLKYLIEKVSQDPISAKMLKVNGHDIMRILELGQGPKLGQILDVLLSQVLDDPKKNKKDYLEKKIKELGKLSDIQLQELAQKARQDREQIEQKRDEMTKKKYWVI